MERMDFTLFNLEGTRLHGGLAQLVEHLLCKQGVTGSSPVTSTKCPGIGPKPSEAGLGRRGGATERVSFRRKAEVSNAKSATTRAHSSAG